MRKLLALPFVTRDEYWAVFSLHVAGPPNVDDDILRDVRKSSLTDQFILPCPGPTTSA
jgi:hypothetical protein